MVHGYTFEFIYEIVTPNKRLIITKLRRKSINIPTTWHPLPLTADGHWYIWLFRVPIGYRLDIRPSRCLYGRVRVCDGPGILICYLLHRGCMKRVIYELGYFIAHIEIYKDDPLIDTMEFTYRTRTVASNRREVPDAFQVTSNSSLMMHEALTFESVASTKITFDINKFEGVTEENCMYGGKLSKIYSYQERALLLIHEWLDKHLPTVFQYFRI